jgi:hypothetical protein
MSFNRVAIVLKVGDQQTAKGREHLGIKDGMPIDIIDEADYEDNPENIISDHVRKVYAVVEVSRALKPANVEKYQSGELIFVAISEMESKL